jgi:hypothetical protein
LRRVGQELIEARKAGEIQGRGGDRRSKDFKVTGGNFDLSDLGIGKKQSAEYQDLARVPEEVIVDAVHWQAIGSR